MQKHVMAAVLAASAGAAFGQCSGYRYGVPDFDQKRFGLDEQGSYHCVPTSTLNWMGFFANRGKPSAMGHSGNWQSQSEYNFVTARIDDMGEDMDTNDWFGTGTSLDDAVDGLVDYLDDRNIAAMIMGREYSEDWQPSPKKFAAYMAAGWYCNMIYGYWSWDGGEWERDGGHSVSLVGVANACDTTAEVRFRNPSTSSDDSKSTQSEFKTATWTIKKKFSDYDGEDCALWTPNYDNNSERKVIDKTLIIVPMFVVTGSTGAASSITQHTLALTNIDNNESTNHPAPAGQGVVFAQPLMGEVGMLAVLQSAEGDHSIHHVDPFTGKYTHLADLPSKPEAVTSDRFGDMIIECDGSVRKYRLTDEGALKIVEEVAIREGVDGLCVDDVTDDIYVLSRTGRLLRRFPAGALGGTPVVKSIPTSVPLSGRVSIAWDNVEHKPFVCTEGSNHLYQLEIPASGGNYIVGETLNVGNGLKPLSLQIGDKGRLMVIGDGSVREFERDPASGRYIIAVNPRFAGFPASEFISLPRSRSNQNRNKHITPAWQDRPDADIGVEETSDCTTDYNVDGFVSGDDFDLFVADFEAGHMRADINFDTFVTGDDFDAFVKAFEEGC